MPPPHFEKPVSTGDGLRHTSRHTTTSQITMPPPQAESPASTGDDPSDGTASPSASLPPQDQEQKQIRFGATGPSASLPPQDQEQKQIRLEGPYLIHLLDHVMEAAPSYLGLISPPSSSSTTP
ncbi:unnamed protein product [Zymoseptoria tritici ST99CH_1A5]|uniref:Uncharacterized protein n=1 Tax=Zymoseptoria tritici ST99CH_1A5 TaxID=1276529 RepID=A0A1Y6M0R7_ZYMTR|nr:unnamed protein product [Zymoseptoria tritici ST99CH_1A5]